MNKTTITPRRTGLKEPSPKATKTSKPLTQAQKKQLDAKRITANIVPPYGHGKSGVKAQTEPKHTWHNSNVDGDQETHRNYQTNSGAWDYGTMPMMPHQPSGPGSKWLKTRELGVMPEETLPAGGGDYTQQIPIKSEKDEAAVKRGQHVHTAKHNPISNLNIE
jgi:hypothetical protein